MASSLDHPFVCTTNEKVTKNSSAKTFQTQIQYSEILNENFSGEDSSLVRMAFSQLQLVQFETREMPSREILLEVADTSGIRGTLRRWDKLRSTIGRVLPVESNPIMEHVHSIHCTSISVRSLDPQNKQD